MVISVRETAIANLFFHSESASFYYRPRPITALEELLMRLIYEVYTRYPFYGVRRITAWLRRQGREIKSQEDTTADP